MNYFWSVLSVNRRIFIIYFVVWHTPKNQIIMMSLFIEFVSYSEISAFSCRSIDWLTDLLVRWLNWMDFLFLFGLVEWKWFIDCAEIDFIIFFNQREKLNDEKWFSRIQCGQIIYYQLEKPANRMTVEKNCIFFNEFLLKSFCFSNELIDSFEIDSSKKKTKLTILS